MKYFFELEIFLVWKKNSEKNIAYETTEVCKL